MLTLVLMTVLCAGSFAATYEELYGQVMDELRGAVPETVAPDEISQDVPFKDRLSAVWDTVKLDFGEYKSSFLKASGLVITVLLITAGVGALADGSSGGRVIPFISSLAVFSVIYGEFSGLLDDFLSYVNAMGEFSAAFIPAFGGVVAACGQGLAAASYSGAVLLAVNVLCTAIKLIVTPLVSVMLAMSLVSGLEGTLSLDSFVKGIGKAVRWALAVTCGLFTLITSVQTAVESATGTAAVSAGKLFVGSAVPVVGGKIAESVGTMFGSFKLMKGSIGTVGIASIIALSVPVAVKYLVFTLLLWLCTLAARLMGQSAALKMLEGARESVEILTAIIAVYLVMFSFSTALIISQGG